MSRMSYLASSQGRRGAGGEPDAIARSALVMMERKKGWSNLFAGGHAAERILKVIYRKLSRFFRPGTATG